MHVSPLSPPRLFPPTLAALRAERDAAARAAATIDQTDLAVRQLRWAFRLKVRAAKAPIILPRDTDAVLWERVVAHDLTHHVGKRTCHQNEIVRRQGDYARRLDALATQRGRE